jgi:hypothetical protein
MDERIISDQFLSFFKYMKIVVIIILTALNKERREIILKNKQFCFPKVGTNESRNI